MDAAGDVDLLIPSIESPREEFEARRCPRRLQETVERNLLSFVPQHD